MEAAGNIAPGLTFAHYRQHAVITVLAMFMKMFSAAIVAYGFARFRWGGTSYSSSCSTMIPGTLTRVPGFDWASWARCFYDPLTVPAWFADPLIFLLRQFFLTIRETWKTRRPLTANTVRPSST